METKSGSDDKPGFFKVLLGDFSERLLIPPAFSKFFYRTPPPQKMKLQTREKRLLEVDLVEIDKKLFFEKGWNQFVKENFLELGDFVSFNYVGSSTFRCTIFGKNACEKDVTAVSRKRPMDDSTGKEGTGGSERAATSEKSRAGDTEVKPTTGNCKQQKDVEKNVQTLSKAKVCLGCERVKQEFKSENRDNPFVLVAMQPSYLIGENKSGVCMPFKFVEHFNKENNNVVLQLRGGKGKSWPMKYYNGQKRKQGILNGGWLHFALDNQLAVGDICVFELIEKTKNILKVCIFKNMIK